MKTLFKEMAIILIIFDVDDRDFAKKHQLGTGEALSGKVHLVFVERLYNKEADHKFEHAKHFVFRFNDMNNEVSVLRDAMKPRAHAHAFFSSRQYFLCCKSSLLER